MSSKGTNTLNQYRDEFIAYIQSKGFDADTIRNKTRHVNNFISYMLGKGLESFDDVTPNTLEEYNLHVHHLISASTKKPLSRGSKSMMLRAVVQFFYYITDKRYILMNPAINFDIPKYKRNLPKDILNEQEMEHLLNQPDMETKIGLRDRAILELMYSTGIRTQELINLNIYNIDLGQGILRINCGKGQKDRVVPVGKVACGYISKYIKEVRNVWLKNKPAEALFIGRFKERLEKPNNIIKKYVNQAFKGKNVTSHTFRHSCATHMIRAGASIRAVQELLGHSCITSTQIYTQITPVDLKKAHHECHPRSKAENKPKKKRSGFFEKAVSIWYNFKSKLKSQKP